MFFWKNDSSFFFFIIFEYMYIVLATMPPSKLKNERKTQTCFCPPIGYRKPFLIILATVTILFLVNATFYLRGNSFKNLDCERGTRPVDILPSRNNNYTFRSVPNNNFFSQSVHQRVLTDAGRFDDSRRYRIYDFVYVGERWANTRNLCLATHASADQLFRSVELAETWQGPISLPLYAPDEASLLYFHYLTRCFPSIRENVSLHLVFPSNNPPTSTPILRGEWMTVDCLAWESSFKNLRSSRNYTTKSYPQNHLRNVARKGCPTPYVFLLDIDIVPRAGLAQQLEVFLEKKNVKECEKCAFVVPTYEILEGIASLPSDKAALRRLVKAKKAQYYHKKVFPMNQGATDPSAWLRLPDSREIEMAYPVRRFPFLYEPFYVAKDDVPAHDERFVGYGFTRNTQTYEMNVAGYRFHVLNSAFAMHRGLKMTPNVNGRRLEETYRNSKLVHRFKQEIYARYDYHPPKAATNKLNPTHKEEKNAHK